MSSALTTIVEGGAAEASAQRTRALPHRIAGRYLVESELGAGGMGVVYRVRDEVSGGFLALKCLKENAGSVAATLFRKEYHTLALLRHPRIIGVHDYGVADGVQYYTMDLLDGADLRELAPMPWSKACQCLRDVATSLALLHAHRLVYRDVTPRNVRATGDGRCKLIDFGALAPFGMPSTLVGTAPFVPPEAVRRGELDQRSDLFSLGALAYFLLTGRHAFEAHRVADLEGVWVQRPRRLSQHLPPLDAGDAGPAFVPKALDDLVLSLLSIDPLARPTSAAEVIERLDAIALREHVVLQKDDGVAAAQSYLLSAEMVGRREQVEQARQLAERAVEGTGGVLVVRHATGMGGSRFLQEVAMEARLSGNTVLRVDGEVERGPYSVARALVARMVEVLPELAKETASADVLEAGWVRLSASERVRVRPAVNASASPGLWRAQLLAGIEEWFLRVASRSPLAICVDNLQAVDEGSAALLALLAASASRRPLVIVAALRTGETLQAPASLRALQGFGQGCSLSPLTDSDMVALVQSLFGDVPNAERWSAWLHRLSGGHPFQVMELARFLVSRQIAQYLGGTWALPQELPSELPLQVEDVLDDRLSALSPAALRLASAFSLHSGALSLPVVVDLAEADGADAFVSLDELVSGGILVGNPNGYRLAHGPIRKRLRSRLTESQPARLHLLLGDSLLQHSGADVALNLESGWHLFHGGEEERGAEILRRVGLELVRVDELAEAVPALEAAVKVYRRLGKPRHELLGLVEPLAFAGYYVDRRLADEYGDETLELLAQETGLALTHRLRPYVGRILSLVCGLVYAFVLHFFGRRGGPRMLSHRIAMLGGISSALTGTATLCLDREGAKRRASVFAPFSVLPRRHAGAFSYALAQLLAQLTEDRTADTIAGLRRLRDQIEAPSGVIGLPEPLRPVVRGGVLFALGALESLMDGPFALKRAAELESCGLRLYDMVACQVRATYHACRGEIDAMREYERKVEMYAIRSGTAWQAEVWAPTARIIAFSLTGDIIGLKRAARELDRLKADIPSLSRYAQLAHGLLALARGEHESAITQLEAIVDGPQEDPRALLGWAAGVGALAAACNEIGEHERARSLCQRALAEMGPGDRAVVATNLRLEIQLALALAGLGSPEEASRLLDDLLVEHEKHRGPVTMGALHEARARVAHQSEDLAALEHHRERMEAWFRPTHNPALIARCARVNDLVKRTSSPPLSAEAAGQPIATGDDLRAALSACATPRDRARVALERALAECDAQLGFLLAARRGALVLVAATPAKSPSDPTLEAAQQRFREAFDEDLRTVTEARYSLEPLADYTTVTLSVEGEPHGRWRPVGLLAVAPRLSSSTHLERFSRGLAQALYEFGDVSTIHTSASPSAGELNSVG